MYLLSLLNGILEPFSEHLFSRKLVEFYSHILAKLEVIQILKLLKLQLLYHQIKNKKWDLKICAYSKLEEAH
jgi:hypothetical protein